ncbi:hypothetical protein LPJ67_003803, partial [Coemansia sp. RSA 1938]
MANDAEMTLEVEIFDGSGNFADWSEQVILALRQKGVLDYVESDMRSHRKRFIRSTAFEVWTELQKLYGVPNTEDLVSNILELFSFRMDPNDKEGRASAVQYSNLMNKIDFSTFSSTLSVVRHALRDRHASTADDSATQPITAGHAMTTAVGVIIVTVVAIIATVVVVTDTTAAVITETAVAVTDTMEAVKN